MKLDSTYHLNDKTLKYQSFAQSKRQHQYLDLPGEFQTRVPQEMVFTDMSSARADEIYCNNEDLLIDLEEESDYISPKTLEKFAKYLIFLSYWYLKRKPYLAVLCHKDPGKESEYFEYAPSLYIKIHYIYFSQDTLWEKYENVINKVKHNETLTDMEALDIAFVSKFISKKDAPTVVEKLCEAFKDAIIEDKVLKLDVKVILSGMILKHIISENKKYELLEMIKMRKIKNELEQLVYDEYGDELDAKDRQIDAKNRELDSKDKQLDSKDKQLNAKNKQLNAKNKQLNAKNKEINKLNKSNRTYQKQIKKLSKLDNLPPEAQKIINSLILL